MRRLEPTRDLELRQLRALVAVIDQGSITEAARSLRLAQSTVSEALAALERALGATVVRRRRGSRESILTAAGQALLPRARGVLTAIDETCTAVAEAAMETRATVNIVANESVSTYVLSAVLPHLRGRWPNTRFPVSVATCPEIRQGVRDGTFDVGLLLEGAEATPIRTGDNPATAFEDCQVIAPTIPLVIFTSPSHPLAQRKHRQPTARRDLTGFDMFASEASGDVHALTSRFLLEDLASVRLHSTGSVEAVKREVMASACAFGILPLYAVVEDLRRGSITRLDIRPAPPTMRLLALLSRFRARHPGVTELIEDIRCAFVRGQPASAPGARLALRAESISVLPITPIAVLE
jgi:molybdate transport repressor ModE-like protein